MQRRAQFAVTTSPAQLAAGIAAVAVAALVAGAAAGWLPEVGAARRLEIDRQVERDDHAVCARLGFDPAAQAHAACRSELRALRQRDREAEDGFL